MSFSLIAAGLMAAGSAISGALSGRSKASTSTFTPNWSIDQQKIQHDVGDLISTKLEHPEDIYAGQRVAAKDQVNTNYSNLIERMKKRFAGSGFGRSGDLLTDTRGLEAARIGKLADVDTQFAGLQGAYESDLINQATRYGFASNGGTQTGQTSGDMLGGAVGGGLSTLTTLLTLNQLLKGGGGGGGQAWDPFGPGSNGDYPG